MFVNAFLNQSHLLYALSSLPPLSFFAAVSEIIRYTKTMNAPWSTYFENAHLKVESQIILIFDSFSHFLFSAKKWLTKTDLSYLRILYKLYVRTH